MMGCRRAPKLSTSFKHIAYGNAIRRSTDVQSTDEDRGHFTPFKHCMEICSLITNQRAFTGHTVCAWVWEWGGVAPSIQQNQCGQSTAADVTLYV